MGSQTFKTTPAGAVLEIARRMFPGHIFAIVATDNKGINEIAANTPDAAELLKEAADNVRKAGMELKVSPGGPSNLN